MIHLLLYMLQYIELIHNQHATIHAIQNFIGHIIIHNFLFL